MGFPEMTSVFPNDTNTTSNNVTSSSSVLQVLDRIVCPVMFGFITVIGAIGNLLVIYVILSRKRMRTVTNILLLNLAFADLAFVLICPPFTAYSIAVNRWPYGVTFCKLMNYLLNVTAYVTVYTLVLISVLRYLTILYSVQTQRYRTKKNVALMAGGVWVVMSVANIPVIVTYRLIINTETGYDDCGMDPANSKTFFVVFFSMAYLLPLFIIAILSVSILQYINKHRPATLQDKATKSDTRKRKASRLIILVVVVFAILWLPIHIHLLVAYHGTISMHPVYIGISLFWHILAYANACVNPFIYNYASQEFRDSFREVVCWSKGKSFGAGTSVMSTLSPKAAVNGRDDRAMVAMMKHANEKHVDDV